MASSDGDGRSGSSVPDADKFIVPDDYAEGLALQEWLAKLFEQLSAEDESGAVDMSDFPRSLGQFRLEQVLGDGGYGIVFQAQDRLNRRVAVKVPWPFLMARRTPSQRIVKEADTIAALDHPGIVKVHESGWVGPVYFISMQIVEGPTLGEWLQRNGQLPGRAAGEAITAVAAAVEVAHAGGVIHRDLKPSNILLRPSEGQREFPYDPVVTDFGLAQGPRLPQASLRTATQAVLGTDHYMSPEQAAGAAAEVVAASDIFSLGVILYELVAGRRPFDAASGDDVRRKIREEEPASIAPTRGGVPRDLVTIIFKCLEKSPSRRYATARELADDLRRFLNHEPILARPAGTLDRAWKYAKRKPTVVAFASALMSGSLLVAGLVGAWISDRMSAANEIAAAQAATAVAEGIERRHQYASNIQHAAEALRHGRRREVVELLEQCRSLVPSKGQRGIEWDWIWAEANRADRTLLAHLSGVNAVRFSPRGDLLASGGRDGRVILWDTVSWTKSCDLKYAEDQEVNAVEFSADGSLLAVGGDDGRLVVYRVSDGSIIYDKSIIDGRVFDLAWIGDGTQVAVGGDGAVLSIIDPLTGGRRQKALTISQRGRAVFGGHPDEVSAVTYARSNNAIGVFLTPPSFYFLDPGSLDAISNSLTKLPVVGAVCDVSLEPGYLAATTGESGGGSVDLFNVGDGTIAASVNFAGHVEVMRYSPAAKALAVAFRDGAIQTCKIEALLAGQPAEDRRFCAHSDRVASLDLSPNGDWLVTGGWDGDVKLWHVVSLNEPFDVPLSATPLRIEFSPCGRWLAIAIESEQGSWQLSVLDARSGAFLWSAKFTAVPGASWLSAFDPAGDEIAVAEAAMLRTFDARTGQAKATHSLPERSGSSWLAYSLDGGRLVVRWPYVDVLVLDRTMAAKHDQSIDQAAGSLGMFRTTHGDAWLRVEPSHELSLLTSGGGDPIMTLRGPSEKVGHAAVSHDGRMLVAGGHEGIIYFWDLNNSSLRGKCVGHEAAIGDVCFSPDGRGILSRSEDGTVRLWDLATRAELVRFGSPQQPVVSMALNAEGTLLMLGIRDGNRYGLRIHRLGESSGSLLRKLESF